MNSSTRLSNRRPGTQFRNGRITRQQMLRTNMAIAQRSAQMHRSGAQAYPAHGRRRRIGFNHPRQARVNRWSQNMGMQHPQSRNLSEFELQCSLQSFPRPGAQALQVEETPTDWSLKYFLVEVRNLQKLYVKKFERKMADQMLILTSIAQDCLLFPKIIERLMSLAEEGSMVIDYFDQFVYQTGIRFDMLKNSVDLQRERLVLRLVESTPKLFRNFDRSLFVNRAVLSGFQDAGKSLGMEVSQKEFLNFSARFFLRPIDLNPRSESYLFILDQYFEIM